MQNCSHSLYCRRFLVVMFFFRHSVRTGWNNNIVNASRTLNRRTDKLKKGADNSACSRSITPVDGEQVVCESQQSYRAPNGIGISSRKRKFTALMHNNSRSLVKSRTAFTYYGLRHYKQTNRSTKRCHLLWNAFSWFPLLTDSIRRLNFVHIAVWLFDHR